MKPRCEEFRTAAVSFAALATLSCGSEAQNALPQPFPSATPQASIAPTPAGTPQPPPILEPGPATPAPGGSPPPVENGFEALDRQFKEALVIRRLQLKNLLGLTLTDAVRLALTQNSNLRLAQDDVNLVYCLLVKCDFLRGSQSRFPRALDFGQHGRPVRPPHVALGRKVVPG
jgi:hypothetical protein